ncbi:uncharacterized protein [Typha angustifolia]|uniref:uncharacterized protein n=1 Tax=Typha angustifolia TaxID=59011 RepID=UPI003C2AF955
MDLKMERSRRNESSQLPSNGFSDGFVHWTREIDSIATIPTSSSLPSSSSSSSSSGANYIEHRVTKMDTLAGIAIKYGVEVADIRRLNGLVTDLQMFAHKTLQIPLPGRHPPSLLVADGSDNSREQTPPRQPYNDILDSLQSLKLKPSSHKVSPAMSRLQGYYGLTPPKRGQKFEGTEMAVYKVGRSLCLEDDALPRKAPNSEPPPSRHRKSRSLVNGFYIENGDIIEDRAISEVADNSDTERSIRRRQKVDASPVRGSTEMLLREENSGGFSGRTGKGLALRPKSGSRTDADTSKPNLIPNGNSLLLDTLLTVRKSSSTSNLQDSDSSSSIWSTSKWSLNPDALGRPIFDGLPKPLTARRKAALD